MDNSDDYIKSAVESEITRMLAKNAMSTVKSTVRNNQPKIKQEPLDEDETGVDPNSHGIKIEKMDEDEDNLDGISIQTEQRTKTGPNSSKYSVKVVTKYMCRYCARQFDSPDEMQEHIASHARGKSNQCHSCYVCSKTYSTPSKLQRHVRVHSGERPYACNICGRRFTRSDHVKQHLKVHMPQKQRNQCRLCSQKFLRRQTLHSHLQQSHGVSTVYTCHRCGEAFDEITKLHAHKNLHISIYGKNEGPAVEGGMVIKQEPGENGDQTTPMIGLAKFSLGPQPAPDDLLKVVNAAQGGNNGYTNKMDGFSVSDETHRLAVALPKQGAQLEKPQVATYSYPIKYARSPPPQEMQEENYQADTLSDGMNMFILPSHIKKEPESPEYSMDYSYKADDTNSSYVDDIAGENQEEEDEDEYDEDQDDSKTGNLGENAVQNLLTGPPAENKGIKMKLFGPASYKAAMRNKIAMKIPTPRLRQMQNPMIRSATMASKTDNINSNLEAKNFSPYIVGTASLGPGQTVSPVQETISKEKEKKLSKCEHCCIWFEDYTMCLLHNSLHSADDTDPFTCRKCMKKLGNRLEFTAHLVWHLEPDMDS
ncbi:uncharacterized protein [Mytilus edulis]|uniref:C2H2-type domain-containing protein n=1 Tax=Mytilus galloprovincialis TaxID=29158 RepID=A0A8B6HRZ0_MYTGA|nr:Hypothetical predicted protein [Mytilus galloprovincialis]